MPTRLVTKTDTSDHHPARQRSVLRDIAARQHTIQQDALARNPKKPKFELIDDQLTLADDTNEVQLFKASGNIHSGLLIYAWIPRDRTLVQADFYDVNWSRHPWGDNFIENLKARNLAPVRYIPLHGRIQTHLEVLQTLASRPKAPAGDPSGAHPRRRGGP